MLTPSQYQQLREWLTETGELYVNVHQSHSGTSGRAYFVDFITDLEFLIANEPSPELVITIFRHLQYPIRGVADDALLALALQHIPHGQWFSILSTKERYPKPCKRLTGGCIRPELRRMLGEFKGQRVAVGTDPFDKNSMWVNSHPDEVMVLRRKPVAVSPASYSVPDLLNLLLAQKGEYIRLEPGLPPFYRIKEQRHEVEGPPLTEENLEQILRELATTRQLREFREKRSLDFNHTYKRTLLLVRAVQCYDTFRLDLYVIEKLLDGKSRKTKPIS
jgi:hypothetical protein